jgi:flagellin-like protein
MSKPDFLKAKRGISPILATLLLIVITVSAIIVTYAWVTTFIGSQTTVGGTRLEVENTYWNSSASTTVFTVRNVGTSDAKVMRLYVGEGASNLVDVSAYTDLSYGKLLPIEQTMTITLDWPNNLAVAWNSGKTYYFKISPEAGAAYEFTWKTPTP